MVLIEWDNDEKQLHLLEILQKDGAGIPNNLVLEATVRFAVEKRYPAARMRFFSTDFEGDNSPIYVFVVEENSKKIGLTSIFARIPTHSHDRVLLETALLELIAKYLDNHDEIRLRSDTFTREVLRDTGAFDLSYLATTAVFYLNDEQREFGRKAGFASIRLETVEFYVEMDTSMEGFAVDFVNIEKDAARIHDNWKDSHSMETTIAYLQYLPSTIIRDTSTGEAVSWNMTSPFGQAINQYTIPQFRGRGLSSLAQYCYGKKLLSEGLSPFKYVQIQNSSVLEASRKYKFSMMWEDKTDNNNEEINNGEATTGRQDGPFFPLQHTVIKKKH